MLSLFGVLLEAGDEVVLSDPHYACYPNFIRFVNGKTVTVPVYERDGFQYNPADIDRKLSGRTKAILINSPSNPTGNILSEDRMQAISDFSPYIVSDEISMAWSTKERNIRFWSIPTMPLSWTGFRKNSL